MTGPTCLIGDLNAGDERTHDPDLNAGDEQRQAVVRNTGLAGAGWHRPGVVSMHGAAGKLAGDKFL